MPPRERRVWSRIHAPSLWLALRWALAVVCVVGGAQAGKLTRVREATGGEPTTAEPAPKKRERRRPPEGDQAEAADASPDAGGEAADDTSTGDGVLGQLLLALILSPVSLPYYAAEESPPDANPRRGYFLPYPYRAGAAGAMLVVERPEDCSWCVRHPGCGSPYCTRAPSTLAEPLPDCPPDEPDCDPRTIPETCIGATCYSRAELERLDPPGPPCDVADPPPVRPTTFQLTSDFGTDVALVYRYGFGASYDTRSRIGLESRFTYYVEPLAGGSDDRLLIGDANLTLRNAQHEQVLFHVGLGGRFLLDPTTAGGDTGGANVTWSFDAYPGAPVAFGAAVDVGNLGEAFYLDARGYLGALLGRVEVRAGYDLVLIHPVVFHGPFAGVRLYL